MGAFSFLTLVGKSIVAHNGPTSHGLSRRHGLKATIGLLPGLLFSLQFVERWED